LGAVKTAPFSTLRERYFISSVQSISLLSDEWRPAASIFAGDYLLVGPRPDDLFVGHLEKAAELYVYAHVRAPIVWPVFDIKVHRVFTVFIDGILKILGCFLTTIRDAERIRAKLNLREGVKCKVKFLHKPLQLIPRSIRPIKVAAL
jgi:hypothetical protein